ncbi:MAG TPA: oligopeptide:H+ symporter [Propionibacteriaceae bacterium]|nr:oligopeptide:H+ symporter [Propionibacteriaceae bacterium]
MSSTSRTRPLNDTPAARTKTARTFFGQPRAVVNLFGVEMWERFSFYGMQGIVLLYLYAAVGAGGLGVDQVAATSIIGAYGGLVYLSTILGAWLADRLWGSERVLFGSAMLVMLGHLALSLVPGLTGVGVGLVGIALGSGGVKANASAMLGSLYAADDSRRDAGFSLFYLGVNIGSFLGPILTGLLQSDLGFRWGFGAAAAGMALGLTQYTSGRRSFPAVSGRVPNPLPATSAGRVAGVAVLAVLLVAALALAGVLTSDRLSGAVAATSVVAAGGYFALLLSSRRVTPSERRRVLAFVPLFVASVAFWTLYMQQFTVLTIYADQQLDRTVLGWTMPVAWVQSINPVFVIILSGVFTGLWTRLRDRQPSTTIKFAAGTVLMGLAFWLLIPMAGTTANSAPLLAMTGVLLVFSVAELLLSPVGLSISTRLAPAAFPSQMVALFYLSIALGAALSGVVADWYSDTRQIGYFAGLGLAAVAVGTLLAALAPSITRAMSGVR